jgi:hypothetical protein
MEFIIIAKSTDGWGVVVGGDVVAEFPEVALALDYAANLRAANVAAGRPTDVVDLSDANTGYPLLKRLDGPA